MEILRYNNTRIIDLSKKKLIQLLTAMYYENQEMRKYILEQQSQGLVIIPKRNEINQILKMS